MIGPDDDSESDLLDELEDTYAAFRSGRLNGDNWPGYDSDGEESDDPGDWS